MHLPARHAQNGCRLVFPRQRPDAHFFGVLVALPRELLQYLDAVPLIMTAPGAVPTLSLVDLATDAELLTGGPELALEVPDAYLSDARFERAGVESLAIQRLLTLAQRHVRLKIVWAGAAARQVLSAPALYPLAAVALGLTNAAHTCLDERSFSVRNFERARQSLLTHRLGTDMFSERQILLCLDHRSPSLPFDLYEPSTQRLRRDDEFESFVDDLLFAQRAAGFPANTLSKFRLPLAVILRELIENTDDHAKTDFDGSVVKPNAMRGLVIKRILEKRRLPTKRLAGGPSLPCLEFTIFDSGIGYYDSYRRQLLRGQARGEPVTVGDKQTDTIRRFSLGPDVPIDTEYAILLKCLERHSDKAIPDPRPGHRGMGLYEVLRALKMMQGMLEVRTGRLHGYRSFLEGELRIQLEPETSQTRPGMPKPSLIDVARNNLTKPTAQELMRGSVVRVVVPLT